jgi:hypothetical protein
MARAEGVAHVRNMMMPMCMCMSMRMLGRAAKYDPSCTAS